MAANASLMLISGRGSNMAALIEAAKDQRLSRRNRAGGIRTARRLAAYLARRPKSSQPK